MTGMNMYMFSITINVKYVTVLCKKNCDTQYMISNHVYVKQEEKKNYETCKLNQHNVQVDRKSTCVLHFCGVCINVCQTYD